MNPLAHAALLALALAGGPLIAVIVDDIGDREADGERAVALEGPVALAFLPHAPYAATLAERAHAAGKEVMLHLPLQATTGKDPGPGAIVLDTGESEFARIFAADLASVPHVAGVNNHMGSLLTRHPGHMAWLMRAIAGRSPLFFIDSYTAVESVALSLAEEAGVPSARRDVFLDSDPDEAAIEAQFDRLLSIAHEQGTAIAIGHPYPETLAVLERRLPQLARDGVTLVSVAALIAARDAASAQQRVRERADADEPDHRAEADEVRPEQH